MTATLETRTTATWDQYRGRLEEYFDRTALDAWAQLTSDAPVSKIRATVRAGRDEMRNVLLSWMPADLTGLRVLDAGCGTGALAVEAARRGADVVAIDVSASLVNIAQERAPADLKGSIDWRAGDMMSPDLGHFDHVVAMDSLIHYRTDDIVDVLGTLSARTRGSVVFTVTPRTPALMLMLAAGKLFPRADRAPAIAPAEIGALARRLAGLPGCSVGRSRRVQGGFYTSQALELLRC
ncbi:MAG: magnesium protoporphyrin IX methyltransferase [Brevundimonas sp.]|uniref:magnesium protoporphyrin IX methyltransferase n=1 Tax=Brevundimonas sp. TaxID=1871086 RepID=UPI002734F195|nr:magnesium protoporphyrin IX methyltransferase [Brevundimonas sp.]MBX9615634.1 magnesium protoporphyrin IX methyltransferase [Caulobacteraceae bacterium]MDP3406469.1 magnesium protoporphyrin IX methyltransferase [Brevundimonas sp.]